MFGTLYTSASDFSTFSYPRPFGSTAVCLESHESPFERRYCPNYHPKESSSEDLDAVLQSGARFFELDCSIGTGLEFLPAYPEDVVGGFSPADLEYFAHEACSLKNIQEHPLDGENVEVEDIDGEFEYDTETSFVYPENAADPAMDINCQDSNELIPSDNGLCTLGASARWADLYEMKEISSIRPDLSRSSSTSNVSEFSSISPSCSSASSSAAYPPSTTFASSCESTPLTSAVNSRAPSEAPSCTSSTSASSFAPSVAGCKSSANLINSSSSSISKLSSNSSKNPWKCPHCPWIQRTQRMPDFLRHQRSHFVTQSDWPCPNAKCGKSFARKDSLKRHLNNKATKCRRPPGYKIC